MATRTQMYRPIGLGTPLGDDVLLITSAQISEQLGRMFKIDLTAISEDPSIDFKKIVGQNVTLRLNLKDGAERYWNGYVSEFDQAGMKGHLQQYRMTIVPWIWFLGRTADFRAYQEMSVPDIVKSIFKDAGYTDYKFILSGSYGKWEYCVQYRETDLNFISRLMEQEGIYYYFQHENGKHTMVVTDGLGGHEPYPGYEKIAWRPDVGGGGDNIEYIFDWSVEQRLQPGAYETMDFDFKNPKKTLKSRAEQPKGHSASGWEVFDYPGEWEDTGDGDHYTRVRLEELQAQHEIVNGESNARGIATGYLFKLQDYPREDQNAPLYLVTSSSFSMSTNEYASGTADGETSYSCTFTAIDSKTPYRPPRMTPKPVIQGPQTAMVVGPKGEEIHTDKYGRVKVQFHWDRYGKRDENASCWIRVAQNWAGRKWGMVFIPRIGMEVIVNFLEGDPDQPIITGCVYNGDQMPPYDLPGKATVTAIKSNSSKGGGKFNEIRIEDKAGSEQLFINASKDYDLRIKNIAKEFVGDKQHRIVKADRMEKVEGDQHLTVKGDQNEKISGTISTEASMDLQQKVGMKHALEAGLESHIKAGLNVVIEAGMSITLKAGGGFIVVGPTGVTIQGMPVLINSGGAAGSGSGCSVSPPKEPEEADKAEAGQKIEPLPPPPPPKPVTYGAQAKVLKQAAISGAPFCEKCAAAAAAATAGK